MHVFQTAGLPPRCGSRSLPINGSRPNMRNALRKSVPPNTAALAPTAFIVALQPGSGTADRPAGRQTAASLWVTDHAGLRTHTKGVAVRRRAIEVPIWLASRLLASLMIPPITTRLRYLIG